MSDWKIRLSTPQLSPLPIHKSSKCEVLSPRSTSVSGNLDLTGAVQCSGPIGEDDYGNIGIPLTNMPSEFYLASISNRNAHDKYIGTKIARPGNRLTVCFAAGLAL